ncbi:MULTISPECIES: cation diffusion facilitator family transporter [unclassified Pseudofrankia]|uniref:cation diffusion facilitator family transporter n=1 Tax=unclassified Pseudofrankia TaxID=2994372 RepID=UPI0009F34E51|nr:MULTISPECIES: cation diffusion facilitator family transporter [unclassified Pseudofrankia]MDT3442082.1 cation diffusion facilitator family transporter [Pseudofrankia sp. BMG5.37]
MSIQDGAGVDGARGLAPQPGGTPHAGRLRKDDPAADPAGSRGAGEPLAGAHAGHPPRDGRPDRDRYEHQDDHGHVNDEHHDGRHAGDEQGHDEGHGDGRGHRGGHGGHVHRPSATADARLLWAALALIGGFLLVEVVVGIIAGSVALLSDAAHMLTDAGALVLALVAMRLAARPAGGRLTYGWRRVEILSAQANGFALLALAAVLAVQAGQRLAHPNDVAGVPVLVTALVGVVVNLAATALLARADRRSLNVEGAFQHVLTDLFAFIATAAAGLVIIVTGFTRADPLAALVVAGLMVRAGAGLIRDTGRVFMEAAPVGVDPAEIGQALASIDEVADVHDLHVWEVTSGLPALSAHLLVDEGGDCHRVQNTARLLLRERWHIDHVTLQVDHAEPAVLTITLGPRWQCSVTPVAPAPASVRQASPRPTSPASPAAPAAPAAPASPAAPAAPASVGHGDERQGGPG